MSFWGKLGSVFKFVGKEAVHVAGIAAPIAATGLGGPLAGTLVNAVVDRIHGDLVKAHPGLASKSPGEQEEVKQAILQIVGGVVGLIQVSGKLTKVSTPTTVPETK